MVTVMEAGFVVQGWGRVEVLLACLPGSCRDHLARKAQRCPAPSPLGVSPGSALPRP